MGHCKILDSCPPSVQYEISSCHCSLQKISNNPIVTNTIRIWLQFRKQHSAHRASIHAPVLKNHLLRLSCSDPSFHMLSTSDLRTLNVWKLSLKSFHFLLLLLLIQYNTKQFPLFPQTLPRIRNDQLLILHPTSDQKKTYFLYLWQNGFL